MSYQLPAGASQAEDWDMQQNSFSGDFYAEEQNVVRGVALMPSAPSTYMGGGFGDGDFYPEADPLKGMGLDTGAKGSRHDPLDHEFGQHFAPNVGTAPQRFSEGDFPPPVPSDPFFQLDKTTLYVACAVPSELGNTLLSWFGEQMSPSFVKVNPRKFTIKADIHLNNAPCTVKVRIYHKPDTASYAVEFQRRRGDVLSFGNCYQMAQRHLDQRCPDVQVSNISEATLLEASVPESVPVETTLEGSDVSPLLDMAGNTGLPGLQAESASALAAIAQKEAEGGGNVASGLCSDYAFEQFKTLLKTGSLDVQYPTARMLVSLTQIPQAALGFTNQGLLQVMLEEVRKAVEMRLQQQLAQALYNAIFNFATVLSEQLAQDMKSGLTAALQEQEADTSGQLYRTLYQAYQVLEPRGTATA